MGGSKIHPDQQQAFQSWCLESSGKGRLEIGRQHHVFDYYSTLESTPGSYVIALDLPLYGEEILQLHLQQKKISGNFLKRIEVTSMLNKFLQVWREWVLARVEQRLPQTAQVESDDEQLKLIAALSEGTSVTLTLHGLNDERFFARQTLTLNEVDAPETMKLELFTFECRNPAMH